MPVLRTIVLLLLTLHLVTGWGNCPDPEDIYPCKCSSGRWGHSELEISCVNVNVAEVVTVFSNLEGKMLANVHLMEVQKGKLPTNLFSKVKGVREIVIHKCDLEVLADDIKNKPFVGLENSLESLVISKSYKSDKNASLNLAHLKRLVRLVLADNNVPEISNDWFENGPVNLQQLSIDQCGVRSLGDRAFRQLVNLEELSIHNNPIGTFSRTMFPERRIRWLVLWNVGLTNPPKDLFSNMPELKGLNLQGNLLERIPSDLFSHIWEQLAVLNVKDNPIICDDHMNWLLKLKRPVFIAGYCKSPSDQEGKTLERYIDGKKREMEQK